MIEVRDISKTYKKKIVLNNVGFSADRGQCVGILGGNGSGKSTLLFILAGTLKADNGSFLMEGVDLLSKNKVRESNVGYVPQSNALIEELTARDNLKLWYKKDELKVQLESGILKKLGIDKFIDVPVRKLSGGMKKRLSLGCTIAADPGILILDEPSAALDLPCKQMICEYISEHKKRGGIVILSTHDLMEIELCDKLFILKDGKLNDYVYDKDVLALSKILDGGQN